MKSGTKCIQDEKVKTIQPKAVLTQQCDLKPGYNLNPTLPHTVCMPIS